jgi:hypothetical protein
MAPEGPQGLLMDTNTHKHTDIGVLQGGAKDGPELGPVVVSLQRLFHRANELCTRQGRRGWSFGSKEQSKVRIHTYKHTCTHTHTYKYTHAGRQGV